MKPIKTVTILGANGSMGSLCAGIIAAFSNATVYMIARNIDKAQEDVERAINSVRSDTIRQRLNPATYDDLAQCVSESDWILEAVAEIYEAKESVNRMITRSRRKGSIVSTMSSGLSVEKLSQVFDPDGQENYFGTHFYNPPYKMLLCELMSHKKSNTAIKNDLKEYLQTILMARSQ